MQTTTSNQAQGSAPAAQAATRTQAQAATRTQAQAATHAPAAQTATHAPHRYPVGIQSFEKVRTQGYLYVDKTEYIQRLVHGDGDYFFLSRPRRFGKTLLISTIEAYFQGRRELFEGLAIDTPGETWQKTPVIRLDLSQFKATDEQILMQKFNAMLSPIEERYGISGSGLAPGVRLDALIRAASASDAGSAAENTPAENTPAPASENITVAASATAAGTPAIESATPAPGAAPAPGTAPIAVLIDEYDAPLLTVLHDAPKLQRFREVMREFYSPLKANEDNIRFLFITGISKFSQLSIFSELNNLTNISMDTQYAGICGITADEIDTQLTPDVAYLAERLGTSPAECRERLRTMYDGYRFAKQSPDVYNPFSLVTAFSNKTMDSYWFGSGTPTSLVNMLRTSNVQLPELEGVQASAPAFDAPAEAMTDPIAFMYQSGYLTIKDYDPLTDSYTLGIPNKEVSRGLSESLLPVVSGRTGVESSGFVARFSQALIYNDDMHAALGLLRSFLAGIPYEMAPEDEKAFQAILYLVFKLVGANMATEVRIATGRIDVLIDAPKTCYVMELKYRREGEEHPNSSDALAQINAKGYAIPYEAGEKLVAKVGVAYSEKSRTIDDDWIIEQSDPTTSQPKGFNS